MTDRPSILTLRPGAKLTQRDRKTLRGAGFVVVEIAPEDLKAIDGTLLVPVNEMLRLALQTIESASNLTMRNELRAELAKRMIASYLALGEMKGAR